MTFLICMKKNMFVKRLSADVASRAPGGHKELITASALSHDLMFF